MREICPSNLNSNTKLQPKGGSYKICYICGIDSTDIGIKGYDSWNSHFLKIHNIITLSSDYRRYHECAWKHLLNRQKYIR